MLFLLLRQCPKQALKDTDLTKLKQQIEELEEEKEKEEKRTKKIDKKCQELTQQNAKLSKQVVGNMALWGARHLIWDQIIVEANKFRPFLDFISSQENALTEAEKKVSTLRREVNKRSVEVAKNDIEFLSSLSDDLVSKYGI